MRWSWRPVTFSNRGGAFSSGLAAESAVSWRTLICSDRMMSMVSPLRDEEVEAGHAIDLEG